jgi:Excalibur calcium-binding domain
MIPITASKRGHRLRRRAVAFEGKRRRVEMNVQRKAGSVLLAGAVIACCGAPFATATPTVRAPWKNCTQVNKRWPHGVGRIGAHDRTSGTPVTTFKRSNLLYNTAMRNNRGLDRDKDGIACEKL